MKSGPPAFPALTVFRAVVNSSGVKACSSSCRGEPSSLRTPLRSSRTGLLLVRSLFRPLTVAYSWMKAEAFALSLMYSRHLYTRVFPSWARTDPFRLFTTAQAFLASFVRVTSSRCARQVLCLASWVFSGTSPVLATHASLFAPESIAFLYKGH